MQHSDVRDAVLAGKQPAIDVYRSTIAIEYDGKHA
jgi:hypothetical protein